MFSLLPLRLMKLFPLHAVVLILPPDQHSSARHYSANLYYMVRSKMNKQRRHLRQIYVAGTA